MATKKVVKKIRNGPTPFPGFTLADARAAQAAWRNISEERRLAIAGGALRPVQP